METPRTSFTPVGFQERKTSPADRNPRSRPHAARLMSVAHARATVRVRFIPRTVGELWAINGPARAFGGVGRTNSPITDQAVKSCLLRQRRFWSAGRGARVANQWIVVPGAA